MVGNVQTNDPNTYAHLDNADIRSKARALLSGKWNKVALLSLIFILVTGGVQVIPRFGGLLGLVITGPMSLGLAVVFLKVVHKNDFEFEDLFKGFNLFANAFAAYLIILVLVVLWSLLLIIPGIIAALSYSMTYYIIAENPAISANEARKKSMELMTGHKWELFFLGLSFLGWIILCIPTLGIGFLWLFPYMNTSFALFYKKLLSQKSGSSVSGRSEAPAAQPTTV